MQPRDVLRASYAKDMSTYSYVMYQYIGLTRAIESYHLVTWYPSWWVVFSTSVRHFVRKHILYYKLFINKFGLQTNPKTTNLRNSLEVTALFFPWYLTKTACISPPTGPVARSIALNPWGPSLQHDWPGVGIKMHWRLRFKLKRFPASKFPSSQRKCWKLHLPRWNSTQVPGLFLEKKNSSSLLATRFSTRKKIQSNIRNTPTNPDQPERLPSQYLGVPKVQVWTWDIDISHSSTSRWLSPGSSHPSAAQVMETKTEGHMAPEGPVWSELDRSLSQLGKTNCIS